MTNRTQQRRCRECDCNLLIQFIHSDLATVMTQSKYTEYICFDCDKVQPTYLAIVDWRDKASKSATVDTLEKRCERRMEIITEMRDVAEARLLKSLD